MLIINNSIKYLKTDNMRLPRWIYPLIEHGDGKKINKLYGITTSTISSIRRTGSGRKENVESIIKFYTNKRNETKQTIKTILPYIINIFKDVK